MRILGSFALGDRLRQLADQIEPGQLGHEVVDDEHVEQTLTEQPTGFGPAGGVHHLVALVAQPTRQRSANLRLIVDPLTTIDPAIFVPYLIVESLMHRQRVPCL